jgi:hypothetical protein
MKRVVVLPEESKQLDETIKVLDGAMARGESIKETMRKLGVTMNAGTFAQAAAQTRTASEAKQHELAEAKKTGMCYAPLLFQSALSCRILQQAAKSTVAESTNHFLDGS